MTFLHIAGSVSQLPDSCSWCMDWNDLSTWKVNSSRLAPLGVYFPRAEVVPIQFHIGNYITFFLFYLYNILRGYHN